MLQIDEAYELGPWFGGHSNDKWASEERVEMKARLQRSELRPRWCEPYGANWNTHGLHRCNQLEGEPEWDGLNRTPVSR